MKQATQSSYSVLLKAFIATFISLTLHTVRAQQFVSEQKTSDYHGFYNRWAVRLSGGTSIFFGDIKQKAVVPSSDPKNEWRFGGSMGLEYRISPVLSLRGQTVYAGIAGTKTKSDRYFEGEMIEGSLGIGLYPINIFSTSNGRFAEFYLMAGIGLLQFDANLFRLSDGQTIAGSGNGNGMGIGGKTLEAIAFAGFGVDFPLNEKWMVSFETINKAVSNDEMDLTVSQSKYDIYNFTSLGLTYKIGSKNIKKPHKTKSSKSTATEKKSPMKPAIPEEVVHYEPPAILDTLHLETKEVVIPEVTIPVETISIQDEKLLDSLDQTIKTVNAENVSSTGFSVQLLASSKPFSLEKLAQKTGLNVADLTESSFNHLYIYTTGRFVNYEDASALRDKIRKKNHTPDAFVVYFSDGKRQAKFPK